VATRPPLPIGVAPLADASSTAAQEALSQAFGTDPLFTYLVPDAARRARFLRWYSGAIVRLGWGAGTVEAASVASTPVAGVAVWLRPGCTMPPLRALLRAGLLPGLPLRLGPTGYVRFVRFARAAEGLHRRTVGGAHWYLLLLGVAAAQQRLGLGSALVRIGLARAAAAGLPCYLETLNVADLPFYQRLGFSVATTGTVPKGGPPLWGMIWAPRAPAGG
jgi:ribosomal protein S18 acetylase RimI-like enzyme